MNLVVLTGRIHVEDTIHGIINAAKKRGHHIQHFYVDEFVISIEDNQSLLYYHNMPLTEPFDHVLPSIDVPDTQHGLCVLRHFKAMGVPMLNTPGAIMASRDKIQAHQRFSSVGLKQPSIAYSSYDKFLSKEMVEMVGGLPCVLKLNMSTCGQGVVLLQDEVQALTIIDMLKQHKIQFFLQEYIPEARGRDTRLVVLKGEVIAAIHRQGKEGDFRSNISQGGSPLPANITSETRDIAVKAAGALKLGLAGVDIIESNKGPVLVEVNSAPGLMETAAVSGVDIASKIIETIENYT